MSANPGTTPFVRRVLPTIGVHNFRDYGGYPVAGGGHVAWRRLYRSADHAHASSADLAIIDSLGLTAVVDLRGASERVKAPCLRPAGFTVPVICSEGETTPAPHTSAAETAFDADAARRNMLNRYAEVAFRPRLAAVYRRYFEVLAQSDGPTLVCCSAGKDRTGVLVALLHHLLGVHHDDIIADYLLTNTAGDSAERIATLRRDVERRYGARMSDEAVLVVTSVFPEFLQAAIDAISKRHGSVDRYLADVLGVTPERRAQLVARLVVPA